MSPAVADDHGNARGCSEFFKGTEEGGGLGFSCAGDVGGDCAVEVLRKTGLCQPLFGLRAFGVGDDCGFYPRAFYLFECGDNVVVEDEGVEFYALVDADGGFVVGFVIDAVVFHEFLDVGVVFVAETAV